MRLFISYSRDDKAWVYELWRALRDRAHHQVWIDQRLIPAQDWWHSILDEIEAAECFIYIMSPKACESIYCLAELHYALYLNKPILPLMLKTTKPPKLIMDKRIQYAALNDQMSLGDVLFEVSQGLGEIRVQWATQAHRYAPPAQPWARPDEPKPAQKPEQIAEVFTLAEEAASQNNWSLAEKLFQQVKEADPKGYGLAAAERLAELFQEQAQVGEYLRIFQMSQNPALQKGALAMWRVYVEKYQQTPYDPRGLEAFFAGMRPPPPPPPPKIEVTQTPPPAPPRVQGGELELWNAAARAVLKNDLFEWCDVPAGPFLMGSERKNKGAANYDSERYDDEPELHQVTLRRFLIAKYPTTYEQFQAFLQDTRARGNYDSWFAGLSASAEQRKMADQAFTHAANLPRENVNWYQSVAFTRWLSAGVADYLRGQGVVLPNGINDPNKPGTALIRLPTEAEWEKAARGTDGRKYPWGNSFDKARCNTGDSGIKKTTPVTAYLKDKADGTSPYGAADMAGNVWEWCLNPWTDSYQHIEAGGISMSGANIRFLRGGSWGNTAWGARAACRNFGVPCDGYNHWGCRSAAAIFILL